MDTVIEVQVEFIPHASKDIEEILEEFTSAQSASIAGGGIIATYSCVVPSEPAVREGVALERTKDFVRARLAMANVESVEFRDSAVTLVTAPI